MIDKLISMPVKRRSVLLGGAALGATTLAAPHVRSAESRKVTFANVETISGAQEILQKGAKEYTKKTGVEVEISTSTLDQVWINVQASLRSGKPIDIFMDGFIGHVALLAAQDAIVPLDDIVNKYKWGPQILFPMDGKTYWMPYDYNFASMHYNTDTYAANGWQPARTHAEFLEINKKLFDGKGKFGSIFPMESGASTNWETTGFFWAEDCKIFDDNWNIIIDNDDQRPRYERVLDFLAELAAYMPKDVASISWNEGPNAFEAGNNGHFNFVPIPVENATTNNTALKGKFGLTACPSSDGKKLGLCHGYDGISVTKSANTDEALKFLEWFADNTYVDFILNHPLFYQSPRLDIYEMEAYKNSPIIKANPGVDQFLQSVLTRDDIILRSIDSQGPYIDEKAAKVFQSWAFPVMMQERLLKGTPAAECVDIGARIMRESLA
ncbi:ABC transporter substrate-binding protein [Brucella anthropi]|uniref:ABC transporter substrate-binding protein n=1 Tax=Brucella anthropi TaxID=529 RepID=UPI001CFDBE86|nr:extracellular solute-binding protein [Brucella anthropi]